MEKTFGGQVDIDFDSIINMDESSIYIDMPSNYTYEEKVFKIVFFFTLKKLNERI